MYEAGRHEVTGQDNLGLMAIQTVTSAAAVRLLAAGTVGLGSDFGVFSIREVLRGSS